MSLLNHFGMVDPFRGWEQGLEDTSFPTFTETTIPQIKICYEY